MPTRPPVDRHRAALSRVSLSRPVERALSDSLITTGSRVLDYGCGRGDDVARLRTLGIPAEGFDPTFFPETRLGPAEVVNLGYVINVIEDQKERRDVLRSAYALTTGVLVVAARLASDSKRLTGSEYDDGVITGARTFQKVFTQEELRQWIETTLETSAVAAAPGVFYVFADAKLEQRLLAARARTRALSRSETKLRLADALYDANRPVLDGLGEFFLQHGRLPRDDEGAAAEMARDTFGSVRRAFAVLKRATRNEDVWLDARLRCYEDRLVYLALARFGRRPKLSALPPELQYDVKEFFGSYKKAQELADRLLFAVGDMKRVETACRHAPVGKQTPRSLYVHVDESDRLPSILRVYKGCAEALLGVVDGATLIKFSFDRPRISFLSYPDFDTAAHPELAWSMYADLARLWSDFRDYAGGLSRPILHRKEQFVSRAYPGYSRFARLTKQEIRAGLYAEPDRIGTSRLWTELLDRKGLEIRGHRLVSASMP